MVIAALGLGLGTLAGRSVLKGSCGGLGAAMGCGICQPSCKAQEIERAVSRNA